MRGSPLLRALIAFLVIAALGWPLWQLTRPAEVVAQPATAGGGTEAKAIGLQLTFTAVPRSFAIRYLEKDVWAEASPTAEMEREVELAFPESGVDLVWHIEWPDDAPLAAARLRLTDPYGDAHEKTVWGQGTVDEVLTIP